MKQIHVTSAYPVTWMRKDWSPQEERLAKEVDGKGIDFYSSQDTGLHLTFTIKFYHTISVVYLHENHAVTEWRDRMAGRDKQEAVAACRDENVAKTAKTAGFKDIFYAKKSDTAGLTKTVMQAVEFAKSADRLGRKG